MTNPSSKSLPRKGSAIDATHCAPMVRTYEATIDATPIIDAQGVPPMEKHRRYGLFSSKVRTSPVLKGQGQKQLRLFDRDEPAPETPPSLAEMGTRPAPKGDKRWLRVFFEPAVCAVLEVPPAIKHSPGNNKSVHSLHIRE
jgi:hypothetical protein